MLFVPSWPMFNWHIFRHEMFCCLFPRGRRFIGIFSGMRCFLVCFLMADVYLHISRYEVVFFFFFLICCLVADIQFAYFPAWDVLLLFPHGRCFSRIFPDMRCSYYSFPLGHVIYLVPILPGTRCLKCLLPCNER